MSTHSTPLPPTTGEVTTCALIADPSSGQRRGKGRPLPSPNHRSAPVFTTAVPPTTGQVADGIRAGA
jgi:hypothetical protein